MILAGGGAAAASSGCAAGSRQIVESRELAEASGNPVIDRVTDLAGSDVPLVGELKVGRSDGVATVGETLWIQGRSFGRQPTVLVGGRPAAALSRTGDGGILVRVPVGTPAGGQPVAVSQENGRAHSTIRVRRYAGVLQQGGRAIAWAELGPEGPLAVGTTALDRAARFLQLSADGRAAYAAGDDGTLTIVEVPAPGVPALAGQLELGRGALVALLAAPAAHRLVVVRRDDLLVLDTSAPLRPIRRAGMPLRLPRGGQIVRAALSPDGRHLAVALDSNRVALLPLDSGGAGAVEADVATDTRAPVLTDVAFAHDGRTLWVAAGDTAESAAVGPQPTRVVALRVIIGAGGELRLDRARTVAVDVAVRPGRLSTGRSLPLASGATIRLPPEKATVYLAASVRGAERSAVFSIGAEDRATELVGAEGRIGGVDVTPEGRWLLAAAVGGDRLWLLSAPADGRPGASRPLALGPGGAAGAAAELRVQP